MASSKKLNEGPDLDGHVSAEPQVLELLAKQSAGDARQALSRLETAAATAMAVGEMEVTARTIELVTGAALQRYDCDQYYDVISAFIKALHGSDPDAALHWLAQMIEAGEDPRFIARRLIVHAVERRRG
ncbi:hypothetical protein AB0I84_31725 [Streptomyces spectabilis]|uniref:AAA family ATPase n=1 Tax=Streptomyces spectabilis TaxID=68270 RepID=UPI0033C2DFA8